MFGSNIFVIAPNECVIFFRPK